MPVSVMLNADANASKARGSSGVRVTPTARGTHLVELWDTMPVGWLSNFTQATTRLHLDIVRGSARRNAERRWSAEFELRGADESSLEPVDFLALAREAGADAPILGLELQTFELSRSSARSGVLALRIQAPDRVGFLASLLAHLAGFVLFPEEILIETFRNEARDALWLSSVGGQTPPPEIEGALRASLRACTRDRMGIPPP